MLCRLGWPWTPYSPASASQGLEYKQVLPHFLRSDFTACPCAGHWIWKICKHNSRLNLLSFFAEDFILAFTRCPEVFGHRIQYHVNWIEKRRLVAKLHVRADWGAVCAHFQEVALRKPTLSTAPSPEPLDLRLSFLSVILIKCQKYSSALYVPLRGNSSRCGSRVSEFPIFTPSLPSNSSLSCWLFDPFMKIFLLVSSDFEGCLQNSLVCRKWK